MDHQTALSTQAIERYTLGELTSPEREEFEEHYFGCVECADALRAYEIFAANARAVFEEDDARARQGSAAPGKTSWWRKWYGMPVLGPALVFAMALVMMWNPAGGEISAWTLEQVRDESPHHTISAKTAWLEPSIELVKGRNPNRWANYHWEIHEVPAVPDAGDKVVAQADAHDGGDQLTLKLKASQFESGKKYKLIVVGDPASGPITSSFIIDRK